MKKKPHTHTTTGVSDKEWTKTFVSSYIATINSSILLVSCAERMGMWIGVFGGGRKEMLSGLNEGRFTQHNEGWTHGFTADVYLKRPGKYCFGTEGFICRYTYPLQPLPPTWGQDLSFGSPLFLIFSSSSSSAFFLSAKVKKMWDVSWTLLGICVLSLQLEKDMLEKKVQGNSTMLNRKYR